MHSSFRSRALVAALLMPVVAGIIVARPTQAAVSHTVVAAKTCKTNHNPKDRDTTGSCKTVNRQIKVTFKGSKGDTVHLTGIPGFPSGLVFEIPHATSRAYIQKGDRINVTVDATGRVSFVVLKPNGRVLTHFAAVTLVPPGRNWHLYISTKHGYVLVKHNKITQSGLYKWVRPGTKRP
ncbi:MAG TPA: hypothetical protein VFE42_36135 [Chloroflexota bacterium]|nr:hypothetical protein [Chloroflexota bacterium]